MSTIQWEAEWYHMAWILVKLGSCKHFMSDDTQVINWTNMTNVVSASICPTWTYLNTFSVEIFWYHSAIQVKNHCQINADKDLWYHMVLSSLSELSFKYLLVSAVYFWKSTVLECKYWFNHELYWAFSKCMIVRKASGCETNILLIYHVCSMKNWTRSLINCI